MYNETAQGHLIWRGGKDIIAEGELVMLQSYVETICVIFTNIHKIKEQLLTLHLLKMSFAEYANN